MPGVGTYRHVVTVQAPGAPVADGDGGYADSWQDATPPTWSVSLAPAAPGAAETVSAGTTVTVATHQVRGRYRADVTTQTRLLLGARVFHVTQVRNPDERNRTLELQCAEVAA